MHDPNVLANVFTRNMWVIAKQTESLTHADSLIQPQARGNCLNYVLGHIAASREVILKMLGLEPVLSAEEKAFYERGSEPITADGEGVIPLEKLLELLRQSEERLVTGIEKLSAADLEREAKLGDSAATLGQRIEFFGWHESYHAGQTEYLRQLAGTNDRVI